MKSRRESKQRGFEGGAGGLQVQPTDEPAEHVIALNVARVDAELDGFGLDLIAPDHGDITRIPKALEHIFVQFPSEKT